MSRTVYLNGAFIPPEEAKISIFDRAVNFGDAVYEVAGVLEGKLVDFEHHMERYFSSLEKLSITSPLTKDEILQAFRELVKANNVKEGLVYMQVSRGVAERDFVWEEGLEPTVFMFTQPKLTIENEVAKTGIKVSSVEDIRWARRDIKTVNLLGQVLVKQIAHDQGAYEALMIDAEGYVTECGSTSFFIITENKIITRPLSNDILPGVTRRALISLSKQKNLDLVQKKFTLKDALSADEAFITGASSYVIPVTQIDDSKIGDGRPGPLTLKLREIYIEHVRESLV